jgi:hypothetical protein
MAELEGKDLKVVIINVSKDLKETMGKEAKEMGAGGRGER